MHPGVGVVGVVVDQDDPAIADVDREGLVLQGGLELGAVSLGSTRIDGLARDDVVQEDGLDRVDADTGDGGEDVLLAPSMTRSGR